MPSYVSLRSVRSRAASTSLRAKASAGEAAACEQLSSAAIEAENVLREYMGHPTRWIGS